MSIYTPERLSGESQPEYRARRAKGNAAAKLVAGRHLNGGISSRKHYRDSLRSSGAMGKRIRAYKALMDAAASKRITKARLRDEHGAYTLVGRNELPNGITGGRRIWLAGVSAQRGF